MPPCPLLLFLCTAFALPVPLARAQSGDFLSALSGSKYPLTLKAKDLDAGWRQVSLGDPVHLNVALPQGVPPPLLGGTTQGGRYFTKGQTVSIGPETFLVAYLVPVRYEFVPFPNERTNWSAAALEKEAQKGDESYALSLLNVRQIISLDDVRASAPPVPTGKVQSLHEHTSTARAARRPAWHD